MQPITVLLTFLLLVVNSAFISIIGVMGLPRNNHNNLHDKNKHSGGSSNNNKGTNISSRRANTNMLGSGLQTSSKSRSSAVTLTDEFPREGESVVEASSSAVDDAVNTHQHQSTATTTTTLSSRVSFTGNSFAEMNNLQIDNSNSNSSPLPSSLSTAAKSSLTTRGGGGSSTDVVMDDDTIDQMVDNLIAGLDIDVGDDDEESEESEGVDEEEEVEEEEGEDYEVEEDESEEEEEEQVVIASVDKDEDEAIDESAEEETEPIATKDDNTTGDSNTQPQQSKSPANATPSSPHNNNNRPPLPLATPTNAYYRFLVRRGPKGHILASLTLISIQWIHVYIPLLYKSAASILLKLHIYDPKVLWQRDRQRREEEERRRRGIYPQIMKKKKGGVMGSVLFSSSKQKNSQQKKERNAQQQRADLHASQTLKQLYKAIKSGEGSGGALSEVKYRYLSVAFRRKYGLGKEYRVEKPMSFLGEVLEGDAYQKQRGMMEEEAVVDEVIILDDGEGEEDEGEVKSTTAAAAGGVSVGQSTTKQQKKKRKKMNDWVVQAFGTRKQQPPPPPKSGSRASSSSSGGKQFESTLWTKVDNAAILQAAWESLAAEQLAWQKKKRTRQRGGSGGDEENDDEYDEEDEESLSGIGSKSSSSGYGASKMFQSVMTRVGSNGRLPGAYPMDAPPIEECANSRGVLDFARRYGYGDWKESSIYYGEDSEDDGDSFGGGDLFSSAEPASQGRRARRKKKSRSISVTDALDDADGKRRKRRKKASSSVKLGMSGGGGGVTLGNNRVSFEFGVSSSPRSSRRQRDTPAISPASSSRRMELNDIKSKLSERSVLFTPDTRVKAPTQLLNNSRDRLRKKNEGES